MRKAKKKPRIEREGITKIIVPHKKGEVTFAWPPEGPGSYTEVGKSLLEKGLAPLKENTSFHY